MKSRYFQTLGTQRPKLKYFTKIHQILLANSNFQHKTKTKTELNFVQVFYLCIVKFHRVEKTEFTKFWMSLTFNVLRLSILEGILYKIKKRAWIKGYRVFNLDIERGAAYYVLDQLLNQLLLRQMLRWTVMISIEAAAIREWGAQLRQPLDSIRWRARWGATKGLLTRNDPKHPLPLPPTPISIHAVSLTMRTRAPGCHCLLYQTSFCVTHLVNRAEENLASIIDR